MFEHFTEEARKVIDDANKISNQCGQVFIDPEHILFALLQRKDSIAAETLKSLGIDIEELSRTLVRSIDRDEVSSSDHPINFSDTTINVVGLAYREFQSSHFASLGTIHLLAGIAREGQSVAAQLLLNVGVDLDRIRQAPVIETDSEKMVDRSKAIAASPQAESPVPSMKTNRPTLPRENPFRGIAQSVKQQVAKSCAASPEVRTVIIACAADGAIDICRRIVERHFPFGRTDPLQAGNPHELSDLDTETASIEEIAEALQSSILGVASAPDKETAYEWLTAIRTQMHSIADLSDHPRHGKELVEIEIGGRE